MKKIIPIIAVIFILFGFTAVPVAAQYRTSLDFYFIGDPNNVGGYSVSYEVSPKVGDNINPGGVLKYVTNTNRFISNVYPVPNETIELWDVTNPATPKSIITATTNEEGKYSMTLEIVCNKQFVLQTKFTGTTDYAASESKTRTVTPTGSTTCAAGQDPWSYPSDTTTASNTLEPLSSSGPYTPLVDIPGIGTPQNLSQYLIGIYNFMLSIVGITAVLMLIIGGFKYLTAAGNPAAATEGKEIVRDAGFGLILALLSWVIVSTINPDVLYIKQPGTGSSASYNPKCTTSAPNDDFCACNSGVTVDRDTYPTCDDACAEEGQCKTSEVSCIKEGTNRYADDDGKCVCVDGTEKSVFKGTDCQGVCTDNCLVADLKIGVIPKNTPFSEIWSVTSLSDSTIDNPLIIQEGSGCNILLEGKAFSSIYYKTLLALPNQYSNFEWDSRPPFDGTSDMTGYVPIIILDCDNRVVFPSGLKGWWKKVQQDPANCRKKGPSHNYAWVCPITLTLRDDKGITSTDTAYFGVERPEDGCKSWGESCTKGADCCSGSCFGTFCN